MLPKVSILIPTYNRPFYFQLALQSALAQTYPNIEIVVGDNSDNDQTTKIMEHYLGNPNIKYFRNERNIGPVRNQQKCFDISTGEYINYLMDDDLFHPQKIEKMMHYFLNYKDITLVTSHKQLIDDRGAIFQLNMSPYTSLYQDDTVLDGYTLGNMILKDKINYIGAPTMVLFRKWDLDEPFGVFAGKQSQNNVDVASWLNLLAKGKAVYMAQALSSFRVHKNQLTQLDTWNAFEKGTQDWLNVVSDGPKKGFLKA
ncbi:glycosyltransferase involved in cell wall biosynthesis [Oikeobacillus pervagus]|uniref:Glycosyltransferase involved in cell wall biosynthesis n=1 Tax=Oikeobacillus pervagus TaxID=1325931 RepID=A0AAJ1WKD6_9BACI|nr:glycosyltransferase family 2 protein [Oikeobacillus pervagus]MDQ0216408.1 glycosyltransferase involved in cell wall biosynthesis [Oikeobacillus pervagus]